jgi:hypothetical protein
MISPFDIEPLDLSRKSIAINIIVSVEISLTLGVHISDEPSLIFTTIVGFENLAIRHLGLYGFHWLRVNGFGIFMLGFVLVVMDQIIKRILLRRLIVRFRGLLLRLGLWFGIRLRIFMFGFLMGFLLRLFRWFRIRYLYGVNNRLDVGLFIFILLLVVEDDANKGTSILTKFLHLFFEGIGITSRETLEGLSERSDFANQNEHVLAEVLEKNTDLALVRVFGA